MMTIEHPKFDWQVSQHNSNNVTMIFDDIRWSVFKHTTGFYRICWSSQLDNIMPQYINKKFETCHGAQRAVEKFIVELEREMEDAYQKEDS